jgi:hypothetical protein
MLGSPSVLMWVSGTQFHDGRTAFVPCGFDFLDHHTHQAGIPTELFAIQAHRAVSVSNHGLHYVHRQGWSWYWEIEDPAVFPTFPFLLTNDGEYRSIYDGQVLLAPNSRELAEITNQLKFEGEYLVDLMSQTWLGVLHVVGSPDIGHLWAYSNEQISAPVLSEQWRIDEGERAFGEINFLDER